MFRRKEYSLLKTPDVERQMNKLLAHLLSVGRLITGDFPLMLGRVLLPADLQQT
jgi:hypothetical protein